MGLELEESICGVGASIEKSSRTSIIKKLFISSSACVDPLTWWHMYEGQFPNASFLGKQILGILVSQIETEHAFSLVGVLIALRLQVDKMDWIVTIGKNWHDDANCKPNFDFKQYLKIELLIEDTYNLIE